MGFAFIFLRIQLLLSLVSVVGSYVVVPTNVLKSRAPTAYQASTTTALRAVSYEQCQDVGYSVTVNKPMGVVFGENKEPYYGLVIDDVAEGLNGGMAGLRVGDQLLSVDGRVVVGADFDSVMGLFQGGSSTVELVMYRGPVTSLYTILSNWIGEEGGSVRDEDEGEEPIIMDENYESPVVIEVKEKKPLSAGDFLKAAGKLGQMMFQEDDKPKPAKEEKKKSGFFGIGGETIQLEGDDATGLK